MGGHARVGRKWSGKILQLVTGCTGVDDWEWGVTLPAHDPMDLKGSVYEMRFDEVTHRCGEFGEFYVGLQLPMDEIFRLGVGRHRGRPVLSTPASAGRYGRVTSTW